ncbi:MAG TPA: PaaI family thioesterase [Caulobacteraceae bacterium]
MDAQSNALDALGLRMAEATPQAAALGLRVVSVEPGVAVMAVAHRPDLVGDPETEVLAGGVVTTLLDHVCGLAVGSALIEHAPMGPIATLDLRIDYMRPAEPGREVLARAHCYKLTHSIAFVRASAFDGDEADPVATVQAAFALKTGPEAPK